MDELREACAAVAARARSVTIVTDAIPAYAAALAAAPRPRDVAEPPPATPRPSARRAPPTG